MAVETTSKETAPYLPTSWSICVDVELWSNENISEKAKAI